MIKLTPADIRDMHWADIQALLSPQRMAVLAAWRRFGPETTRQLARLSGIDLLNVRPRTTELVELGLVALLERVRGEGVYQALPEEAARKSFAERKAAALGGHQPELALR